MPSNKNKKKIRDYFRRGTLGFKILFLTLIFVFLVVAILSPFILIEGSSRVLATILVVVVSSIYVLIILIYIWDWLKENYQSDDDKEE
ncbi:MAG: hypothetical protein ACOX26_03765 [Bacilli bacterium]